MNALIVGAVAAAVCLVAGIGIGAAAFGGDSKPASSKTKSTTAYAAETTTPTTEAPLPVVSDFSVLVAVTEQKCFGSAGCNYELSVTPQYVGTGAISDDLKVQVIYELIGGDDPQTGNFNVENGRFRWDQEKSLQGQADAAFTTRITQVLPSY